MRNSVENTRILLLAFGAALGAVVGFALDLRDYWLFLPAILGAAVGLAASYDEQKPGERVSRLIQRKRPKWAEISSLRRRRGPPK